MGIFKTSPTLLRIRIIRQRWKAVTPPEELSGRFLLRSNQDRNLKVGVGKENWKRRASGTVERQDFFEFARFWRHFCGTSLPPLNQRRQTFFALAHHLEGLALLPANISLGYDYGQLRRNP